MMAAVEYETIMPVLGFMVTVASLWLLMIFLRSAHYRRMLNLKAANQLTDQFFKSAEELSLDPATPAVMLEFIQLAEQSMFDRRLARMAARKIMFHDRSRKPRDEKRLNELLRSMDKLRDSRPDIVHSFFVAVNAAMVASLLRWRETAPAALALFIDQQQPEQKRAIKSVRYLASDEAAAEHCCAA